jgi:putative acetyltransferase
MAMNSASTMTIRPAQPTDHDVLVDIWLRSVRATHKFLSEDEVQSLLLLVRDGALAELELWVLCSDADTPIGFLGLTGAIVEALFIAPEWTRRGGGRLLIDHARRLKGALAVDVNEQNPEALRFYEACGFVVVGRSPTDTAGRPYPLLHLRELSPQE